MKANKFHTKVFSADAFPFKEYSILLEDIYTESALKSKLHDLPDKDYTGKTVVMYEGEVPVSICTLFPFTGLSDENGSIAFIGYFETLYQDCKVLFRTVDELAKELGIKTLIGPVNGSTWENYRFTEASEFPLFPGEPVHPDSYPEIWIDNKFSVLAKYYSSLDLIAATNEDEVMVLEEKFRKEGLKFRNLDLNNFDAELDKLYSFCLIAFKNNYLYSPISLERFKHKYHGIQSLIDPRFVIFAVNDKDDLLGFILSIPNFMNQDEKQIIVKTLARHPDHKFNGLGILLGSRFMKTAVNNEYHSVIHAFMHENNKSTNVSSRFNGELIRTYYLYSKQI